MRGLAAILILGGMLPSSAIASPQDRIGYPVHVSFLKGKCAFQVQDMILNRERLRDWMEDLPIKDRKIDIVSMPDVPKRCSERAEKTVRRAGFEELEHVEWGTREYPSGLPPRG